MLQWIKNWLYSLIVSTGILHYAFPLAKYIALKLLMRPNHEIVDENGFSIPATKLNSRLFPPFGVERFETIKTIDIRDDDVMLCGYPKTGCHWTHEILQMLINREAKVSKHGKTVGMIELLPNIVLDSHPSPRILNSHLLYEELPTGIYEKKTKIILTMRSPKDVVVSKYNHTKNFHHYKGLFKNYFDQFVNGELYYGSFFSYYQAWNDSMKREIDNRILIVEYESLKADPIEKVKEIAKFLDIAVSDDFIENVVEASSFSNVKKARATSKTAYLYRKGIVGDWKNWLTESQSDAIDKKYRETLSNCNHKPSL